MLALLALAIGLTPQAQQQRDIAVRAEEQQRQIVHEQREQVEREHAEERLLQRRAAEAASKAVPPQDEARVPRAVEPVLIISQPSAPIVQTRPDFSLPLMLRSAAAGLLAGLCVFLLGRFVQHKLPSGHNG